jgi:hypothetical protein
MSGNAANAHLTSTIRCFERPRFVGRAVRLGARAVSRRPTWVALVCGALVVGGLIAPAGTAAAAPLIDCVSSDNGDPVMTDVTFSSSVVDVTEGPKTVTVIAATQDTGGPGPASGVRYVWVSLEHGNGNLEGVKLQRNASGDWVGTVTIWRWTKPGPWRVSQALLRDRAGHETLYGNNEDVVPFDNTFTVVSTRDDVRPDLTAFTLAPNTVDTTHGERGMRFTARATDDLSGVRQVVVGLVSPTLRRSSFARLLKVPGTADSFAGRAVMPSWIATSKWKVWFVYVIDRAGNYRLYYAPRLKELGFKTDFSVVSHRDTTEPTLVRFNRSPSILDVRTADATVTVTVHAKDTQSGVKSVEVSFSGAHGMFRSVTLQRVSGTRQDGVWQGTLKFRQCPAHAGVRYVSVQVADERGHAVYYPAGELNKRGWPSTLRVLTRPDAAPPTAHLAESRGVPLAGPVTVMFGEPVNGLSDTSVTVQRDNPDTGADPGPLLDGNWLCRTGSGTATSCTTGRVRKATFRPAAPFHPNQYYLVTLNPEHSLEVTDLAGNPFDRDGLLLFTAGK